MKTKVVAGPYKFRRNARRDERQLTLDMDIERGIALPPWTQGVRVEKAGLFQWVVVATSTKGH